MEKRPVLVTLTSPTASGKSYLFNYIRDVAKLPCLISTTTRRPRANEVDGVDYYFVTEEESLELEHRNELAELAVYRGVRYGVTKKEFFNKLSHGLAFLIVEPSGIDHYVRPALDIGAIHYKAFVQTDTQTRIRRFKDRMYSDLVLALGEPGGFKKTFDSHLDRFHSMHTEELKWFNACQWDRVVFGTDAPQKNLDIILNDVDRIRAKDLEVRMDKRRLGQIVA